MFTHWCKSSLLDLSFFYCLIYAVKMGYFVQNGANFVVTPVLREDIAVVCNRRKVLWSPGCGSLTEITKAEELGAEIVKLFPGSTYGPVLCQRVGYRQQKKI